MDNPLDTLGELFRRGGDLIGAGLGSGARVLENATGDAVTAALFAGFLLFALSLLRGAVGSRNFLLYGRVLAIMGAVGLAGVVLLVVVGGISGAFSVSVSEEDAFLYRSMHGADINSFSQYIRRFFSSLISAARYYVWYGLIFVIMIAVGYTVERVGQRIGDIRRNH